MIRNALSLFVLAGAFALSAPLNAATPFPIDDDTLVKRLSSPVLFKLTEIEPGTKKQRLYYGFADKLVWAKSAGPLPEHFAPVFSLTGPGKVHLLGVEGVRRVEPSATGQMVVTYATGEKRMVEHHNTLVAIPDRACAPGQQILMRDTPCRNAGFAGLWVDTEQSSAVTDVVFPRVWSFTSIEILEGSEAVAVFKSVKAELDERLKAAKLQAAADESKFSSWRANLKEGSMTNCGMVIERKKEIVNVQMENGARWIRIDRLKEPGSRGLCN